MKAKITIELTEIQNTNNNYDLSRQAGEEVTRKILDFINKNIGCTSVTMEINI